MRELGKILTMLALGVGISTSGGCGVQQVEGDLGVAREGDPCAKEDTYACTRALDAELKCTDGVFALTQECPGGCELEKVEEQTLLQCLDVDGNPR